MSPPAVLYQDEGERWGLVEGDSLELLPGLPEASVDAVVTDPPYGIDFHGEAWDRHQQFTAWTQRWASDCRRVLKPGGHLLAFGAPRTLHRLTSGIEEAGLEVRDLLLWLNGQGVPKSRRLPGGQATALRPSYEPIVLARAPLAGTFDQNQATHGTGALHVGEQGQRWPTNVALSHHPNCSYECCVAECGLTLIDRARPGVKLSRAFYCAKSTTREREAGCDQLPVRYVQLYTGHSHPPRPMRNIHPTVKPLELMRWLVRLAVPEGGIVLDPFTGSGSTGAAAVMEHRTFLGIERDGTYIDIACSRINHWALQAARKTP